MPYKQKHLINAGGQGEVWKAETSDHELVALKYLKVSQGFVDAKVELKRFEREISCQSGLDHAGIVPILDKDLKAKKPYFVMPLAEGSLRDLLVAQSDGLSEKQALAIFVKMMDAVKFAHQNGVLHRDLKPENILFFAGEPRIADFGLGRRLHSGSTTITIAHNGLGTLQYAAPEQLIDGHSVDERADVYSLGRILFEMLSGKMAFPQMDLTKVPPKFRHVIMKSTSIDVNQRYSSVKELRRDVKAILGNIERPRSPSDRATALVEAFKSGSGGPNDAKAFERILIEHSDDAHLYRHVLVYSPSVAIRSLAQCSRSSLRHIVNTLDNFLDDRFPFEYTDEAARCLKRLYDVSDDFEIRRITLKRTLVLGQTHRRFFVRDRFIEMASDALKDPTYAPILADIFRQNPECKPFAREQLAIYALPELLADELAA